MFWLDPALFVSEPLQVGNRYESLLEEERRFAVEVLRAAPRCEQIAQIIDLRIVVETPIALLLCVGLIGYLIAPYRRYGREPELPEIEYEREPLREISPAVVPAILTQSRAAVTRVRVCALVTAITASARPLMCVPISRA